MIFFHNLSFRFYHFNYLLGKLTGGAPTKLLPFVFYVSFFLVIILLLLRRKEVVSRGKLFFLFLLYLVLFILSSFSPASFISIEHLLVLFPFPQLIIAVCLTSLYGLSSKKILRGLIIFIFLLLFIEQQIAASKLCAQIYRANRLKVQIKITDYFIEASRKQCFYVCPKYSDNC